MRIAELEEENKELKEKYDGLWEIYTSEANELKEENKKLEEELDKIKQRVKEHTTYSVKAEFEKKFGE